MACSLSYLYISLYNVLPEAFVFTCKQDFLQTCKYDQSHPVTETYIPTNFMLIYGFLFELWVSNLNEEEEEEKNKLMKNSAHHSPIHQ